MTVRRKSNGKWEVRVVLGGRRVGRTFDRKGDADTYDVWINRRKQLGEAAPPARDVTVAEFVEVYWRLYAIPNLAGSTREAYKGVWTRHLHQRIGTRGLRELTPPMLTRLRADLASAGLGDPTVLKAFTFLQGLLSFAVAEGKLETNPAREVKKPSQRSARKVQPVAPETVEELRDVLRYARSRSPRAVGLRDATIVSLLAYGGLRTISELRALEWIDIGTKSMLIHVSPKTGATRTVRLLAPLTQDLAEWRLASGRPRGRRALVFARADGEPWRETDWRNWRRRHFRPAAERVGLDASRPYDLRHSFASLLIAEGKDVAYVAGQLGNSVAVCSNTYIHLFQEFDPDTPRIAAEERIRRARETARERRTRWWLTRN